MQSVNVSLPCSVNEINADSRKSRKPEKPPPQIPPQKGKKRGIKREKLLEAERKRAEKANRKAKLSRAELKEKAKTDQSRKGI